MSEKELKDNKKIVEMAESQITNQEQEQKIAIVKEYLKQTLNSIDERKAAKTKIEEELRILNADVEDLRAGKFDKIEERIRVSQTAARITSYRPLVFPTSFINWQDETRGTYQTFYKVWII